MDYQKREEELLNRIRRGDNNFSQEDFIIIENRKYLALEIINAIGNNTLSITKKISDEVVEPFLAQLEENIISKEICSRLCYEYIKCKINDDGYYSATLDSFFESFDINDEYQKKIRDLFLEKIKDPNFTVKKADFNYQTFCDLLNYKKYSDLEKIVSGGSISHIIDDDFYKRVINEWPTREKPSFIIKYEKEKGLYTYSSNDSFKELLDIYYRKEEERDNLSKIIVEKISRESSINELTGNNKFGFFVNDYCSRDPDNINEFFKLLFDKNYIFYSKDLLEKEIITKEEYKIKEQYIINNNLLLPDSIFYDYSDEHRGTEELNRYLIGTGRITFLALHGTNNEILQKYEASIIEQINNNNPNYEHFLKYPFTNMKHLPNLFKTIMEKAQVEHLDLSYLELNDSNIELIENLLEKKGLSVNIASKDSDELHFFINKLLDQKKYDVLIKHSLITENYLLNNTEKVISNLDNLVFANLLVSNKQIIKIDSIVYKLLSNEFLVEKVVDLINHNESAVYLYNDKTYNIIKDYYIRNYQLNGEHLDILESTLGPNIVRYISSTELKNVVNLNDDTFKKVIGLFPKQEYSKKDLEASYESLIQYYYGKNFIDEITIFPSFLHAIEDNDLKKLDELKDKLIIYTDINFLKELCQKYNLEKINHTGDLLNLIISKYNTPEREKYLEILHDLTNEFICVSRENFRNNHYYEEKFEDSRNYLEKFISAIDSNNEEKLNKYIYSISPILDKNFYKKFTLGNIEELQDPKVLIQFVAMKIRDKETRAKYLPILKEIVDYYENHYRKVHSQRCNLGEELGLKYNLDEKSSNNEFIRYAIINLELYYDENGRSIISIINESLSKEGFDEKLIHNCIKYYFGVRDFKDDLSLIQSSMPIFVREATKYIKNNDLYDEDGKKINKDEIIKQLDKEFIVKRNYYLDQQNNPYQILLNLNIELLEKGLFKDEELYKSLVDIMNKKKLHLIPEELKKWIEKCNISSDSSIIAGFINFYGPIVESERKKALATGKDPNEILKGLASILINAETYSGVSNVYSQILGEKDSRLIRSNPNPNSAVRKIKNNQRLNEAVELTVNNFRRQEVTIPSFDENISFTGEENEEKVINVIVGNFTDPSNLTHGERTGACMRIGGVGESLFDFCLKDPNGFHIRFEDPETHEYISRVSGFRNGNTVFLNELRFSCDSNKFSDYDLVCACKKVAERLIELSKDSSCPIENVVISKFYAMLRSDEPLTNLGIANNKEGLTSFYSDVGTSAIVLATSKKDGTFAPVNFDKSNIPTYRTCRSKPIIYTQEKDIMGKISRVASIKELLSGVNFEDIGRMNFDNGIMCGVVSDDWYIYVDNQKNINYDYIDIDERAKKELEQYLEIIDDIIKKAEISNIEIGSDNYVQQH